jgi:nitrite reductase/ring-hydroxylating ferredoxin subunit
LDSTWNYLDIPHAQYVHDQIDSNHTAVDDGYASMVAFLKLVWLKIPLSITNYSRTPLSMTYYMTWLFFVLIVETEAEEIQPNLTKVITKYHIGSTALFKLLHPLIRWTLEKNYKVLMSSDIPMRERRGQLREWGYSFDGEKPSHSFERSLDISRENVIFPKENNDGGFPIKLALQEILPSEGEYLHGRDDHLGLQIIRNGDVVGVYPRLCPHEGASLDKKNFWVCTRRREVPVSGQKGYKIMCPWHGRLFEPIAQFELSSGEVQKAESRHLFLSMEKGVLFLDKKD